MMANIGVKSTSHVSEAGEQRERPDSRSMTQLQQHVAFFDRNNDGIVYPWETYWGLRSIGYGIVGSSVLAFFFNVAFSYLTLPGWVPSLLLPVYIDYIHKGKHGSDSDIYNKSGRFVQGNLEKMFSQYAHTSPNKITLTEIWKMTEDNRDAFDFAGWIIAKFEWLLLYLLAKDEDGFLTKEAVRGCFDGSLFKNLAKKHKEKS